MKSFFYWTAADEKNQRPEGSMLSTINADVSGQSPVPRDSQRIPIAFLDADVTEEQPVRIRFGAVELPRKRVRKESSVREACALVGCL